ncbi:ester cyclase [Protofrankia symbiont of Coriaria ruscifolia]|uniref:Ester cyclase n=1 Tax=Candidatus Protofrankia californiensis TaxID=1839754 RepID=A0A1C3NT20_9ACTN|nr:ester cyclase [Protofrankia symbiont of Coriaria ruscifolia]SBW17407.1 protein of unknown function DUF1486 [Candidatus Protofrankia californiensis]
MERMLAETNRALCARAVEIMALDEIDEFTRLIHPDAVNREADAEPPACRGRGPAAFRASARWLQDAYTDLRWEIHDVVTDTDLVTVRCTMSGRHVDTFVAYDEQGRVADVFPPTGKTFATTQTHWFRVADGQVVEHWANRDYLGTARQLGWLPPTPPYLMRMAREKRRVRRSQARSA